MKPSWRDRPLTWPMAIGGVGLIVAVSLLASCGAEAAAPPTPTGPIVASPLAEWDRLDFQVFEVRAGERTITCVYGNSGYGGVLSCDWGSK